MTGPTPKMPGEGRPGRPDHEGQLLLRLAQLGIQAAQVGGELGGELAAGPGDRAGRRDLLQDAGGVSCGDLLGGPARTRPHSTACRRQATWFRARPGPGPLIDGTSSTRNDSERIAAM